MKNKFRKHSIIIYTFLMISVPFYGQVKTKITDTYQYSIKPGTQAWESKTHDAKKAALQIPDANLQKISTRGLVKTCLDYPFFMDVMFYNNFQEGFNHVANNFNGLSELLKREDAAQCLLQEYKEIQTIQFDANADMATQGRHAFKMMYLELMLSQSEIISSLDKEDAKQLVSEGLKKYEAKKGQSMVYGNQSLDVNFILIGKLLQDKQYSFDKRKLKEKHLIKVLNYEEVLDEDTYEEIMNGAIKFTNE